MSPLSLIPAFLALLTLSLAIYILRLEPKNPVNRLFFVMMLLYSFWEFILVVMVSTESKERFVFLYKITTVSFLFIPMTLHIVMMIVKLGRKIMVPVLSILYPVYLYFLCQNLNLNLVYRDFARAGGRWIFIRPEPNFITSFYMTVFGAVLVIAMMLIIHRYAKTGFAREKKQSLVLLASLALLFTLTFIDYVVFYITSNDYGIFAFYICVWPIGIGYAIIRHRFLSVPPELYSHEIFESIEESVLVLDHSREILYANSNARRMMFRDAERPDMKHLNPGFDAIIAAADRLLRGETGTCVEHVAGTNSARSKLAFQVKFSVIRDRYGDRIGVLAIALQMKGMKEFTAEYRITGRELEVIRYATAGLSNREIGEQLGISERTIETHMVNIYNKLTIKNKIELINVYKKYGLA